MRLRCLLLLASSLFTGPGLAIAQQPDPPPVPYVLHVYANLIQIPTLALDADFNPLPPLDRNQFFIRLDAGPAFHPTKLHIEADEPISLAILLDASGDQDRLLPSFASSLAQLANTSLKPHDHVSVFALDCHLIRSGLDIPADPVQLQIAVEKALTAPTLHDGNTHGACGRHLHLWDAASQAVHALSDLPGRRVLLLVTSGNDHHSTYTPVSLRLFADQNSVAVFALRDLIRYEGDVGLAARPRYPAQLYFALGSSPEDNLTELCESNGGLIITLTQQELTSGLQRLVSMLRGRYILEFPRPDARDPGEHHIDVTVPSRSTFLVTAGVSVPLPDQSIATDPNTVPTAPSPAILGKRHPLSPKP